MSRRWSAIGILGALALIGAALAWAVLSDGDSDRTTAASSPPAPAAPKQAREKPRLELSDRGEPIVWLRKGARVPIHAAPGGKVVKTLGWRTPFESRTVLSVFRRVHASPPRERVCDLGYLRTPYQRPDGRLGYRCPAEPVQAYVDKGGRLEETVGRHCLCNALMANIDHAQVRADGRVEPPLLTSGDDLVSIDGFLRGRTCYTAAEVLDYLLDGESQQAGATAGAEAKQPGP